MKYIWFNLKDNEEFNLKTCALVLVRAANQVGLKNNYYDYDVNQIKKVLARYNEKLNYFLFSGLIFLLVFSLVMFTLDPFHII
ncbi:hypothetical protein ACQVV5_10835 [Bacillus pretiosus]